MEGIKYVMDEQNRKVAVQIDLEKYGELWEAIYDAIVAESRKGEESVDWEEAKQNLKDEGKLWCTGLRSSALPDLQYGNANKGDL